MILHLLSDPDFDNAIIHQFETVSCGQNVFVVFNEKHYQLLLDKNFKINLIYYKTGNEFDNVNIEGVIIHCMTWQNTRLILSLEKKIPVFWSIFGIDIYSFYPNLMKMLYEKETKKYVNKDNLLLHLYYIAKYYQRFLFSLRFKDYRKAIKRVNFYSTVIPSEVKYIKSKLSPKAKYIRLNVGFLDLINNNKNETILTKNEFKANVYIGNSATLTCNHLDVLNIFKKKNISDLNVTVQLSYGGSSSYVQYIVHEYKKHFKNRFYPLLDWIPFEKFNELLSTQNIFIFYTIRQQGVGAIIVALWNGGKVYLSEKNITTDYFKSIGLKIFSIEKDLIEGNVELITAPLTSDEIVNNREILKQEYSFEIILKRTENVIHEIDDYNIIGHTRY